MECGIEEEVVEEVVEEQLELVAAVELAEGKVDFEEMHWRGLPRHP